MKRINYILTIPLLQLLLSACDSDNPDRGLLVVDEQISFVTDMPGVSSRTNYDLSEKILSHGITVSAISPERDNGYLPVHFEGKIVSRDTDGAFRSDDCKWPGNDKGNGALKFFAFHPSIDSMKTRAGVGNECFRYSNSSKKDASGISYDYRLTKFRVAPDISRQVDFVTAIGEGNKTDNLYTGIELNFEHQLSGVEIGVWGASALYDIEVAGVRIGGIVIEADFILSAEAEAENPVTDENTIGAWHIDSSPLRGCVDYVFTRGDKVVAVNDKEHNTKEQATSIMGANGGIAMVIPYSYEKWDYKNDRENNGEGKGAYISVLLRMTQRDGDHHRIFPSADPQSADDIVYLSVRKSDGTVMKRLDKNGNIFGKSTKYDIPDTEELRHYGWAAAPAKLEWKAGYTYSYVLDYTYGVGVHDPADNNPASTIVNWDGSVEITAYGGKWGNGETIKYGGWGANSNDTAPDGTIWWK